MTDGSTLTAASGSTLQTKARTQALVFLAIVSFFNYMDRSVFSVLAVPIKEDLNLSDTEVGVLGGLGFALFYAALGIPIARLADKKNRINILSICLAVWSAATALCGAVVGFVSLLLGRIGVASGEAGCVPASYSILSDYYPANRRAFAFSIFQFGGNIGFLFGIVGSGLLLAEIGWRMTFVVLGVPGVLFAIALRKWVKEPARGVADNANKNTHMPTPKVAVLFKRRAFLLVIAAYCLITCAFYAFLQWMPHLLARVHTMNAADIGLYYGLAFGVGTIIGAPVGGILAPKFIDKDRRWEMWFSAVTFTLAMPFFMAAIFVGDQTSALISVFIGCFVLSIGIPAGIASIHSLAEPNMRATATAITMLAAAIIGQGLGPTLVGVLSDVLQPTYGEESIRYALFAALICMVPAGVLFYFGGRRLPEDAVC